MKKTAKKWAIFSAIVVIAIVLVLVAIFLFPEKGQYYLYKEEAEGIVFESNYFSQPIEYIRGLNSYYIYLIVNDWTEGQENSDAINSVNTAFVAVLNAKDKNVVSVIKVYDDKGNFAYCQTNLGQKRENKQITAEECNSLLLQEDAIKFMFTKPDPKLKKPEIIIEKNYLVTVKANTESEMIRTAYLLLKAMYPDADTIIQNVNSVAGKVK
ncbi:MAG: hypothetical protein AB1467_01085 [Candidatus Diapherotrites archaeon]